MLVLSRDKGESVVIMIDGEVVCTVTVGNGNKVKLCFEADERVVIHRKEVHDRITAD